VRNFINIIESFHSQPDTPGYDAAYALYIKYGQPAVPFSELPPLAQNAVLVSSGGDSFEVSDENRFGLAMIPMQVLKDAIMTCGGEIGEDWESFDAYHEWYMKGPDVIPHTTVWPIILGHEIISDGWHRFHHYVEIGLQMVPAIWIE
jgi:hypothetical protein